MDANDVTRFLKLAGPALVLFEDGRSFSSSMLVQQMSSRVERNLPRRTRTWKEERAYLGPNVAVFVGLAVPGGTQVSVRVGVFVIVGETLGVGLDVGKAVGVSVTVAVRVGVDVSVGLHVAVAVSVGSALAVGLAGILSVIPALNDLAIAFGLLQIVWFVWLGIAMLRTGERPERLLVPEVDPA
mgnify:CR=1 FL=1